MVSLVSCPGHLLLVLGPSSSTPAIIYSSSNRIPTDPKPLSRDTLAIKFGSRLIFSLFFNRISSKALNRYLLNWIDVWNMFWMDRDMVDKKFALFSILEDRPLNSSRKRILDISLSC